MQVNRDAVPWALIYSCLNEKHESELQLQSQRMVIEMQPLIVQIVKQTMVESMADASGVRALCEQCCGKGWVSSEMVEQAIATWEAYARQQSESNYGLMLLIQQKADWLRADVSRWSSAP